MADPETDVEQRSPHENRRAEVFKAFFATTRPVIYQIIDEQMAEWEVEFGKREAAVWAARKDVAARERQLEEALSNLSDRLDTVATRELVVEERERVVAERERQLAVEWDRMQAIKASIATLINGRG